MRVWIDLANSPHVAVFERLAAELPEAEILVTARDHAQTVELARGVWPDLVVVGGESPAGRRAKAAAIARRARDLAAFARERRADVALSHGSYAQALAARRLRLPLVTMMDYEFQPANHLSFRLAARLVVPAVFPREALRRCGAQAPHTLRYVGFKEDLYLAGFVADAAAVAALADVGGRVLAVLRPAPEGALYHRGRNGWFDEIVEAARRRDDVLAVLLPRTREQAERYGALDGLVVPRHAVDARSLCALADLVVGAGGTMSREAALLGTPTYTVFAGRFAAVDLALVAAGTLHDLRGATEPPPFRRKEPSAPTASAERAERIVATVRRALAEAAA